MSCLGKTKAFYFCNLVNNARATSDVVDSIFNMAEGGFDEKRGSDISGKLTRITIYSSHWI